MELLFSGKKKLQKKIPKELNLMIFNPAKKYYSHKSVEKNKNE